MWLLFAWSGYVFQAVKDQGTGNRSAFSLYVLFLKGHPTSHCRFKNLCEMWFCVGNVLGKVALM